MLVAGFVVAKDLLRSHVDGAWMAIFLVTGVLTSATGFGFPFDRLQRIPLRRDHFADRCWRSAILGLYVFKLAGPWRWIFALSVVLAFYFDALVTVAQTVQEGAARSALRPRATNRRSLPRSWPCSAIFVWLCVKAFRQFRPAA